MPSHRLRTRYTSFVTMKQPNSSKNRYKDFVKSAWTKNPDAAEAAAGANSALAADGKPGRPEDASPDHKSRFTLDPATRKQYFRQYRAWLRPYFPQIGLVTCMSLIGVGLAAAKPILMQQIVDHGISAPDLTPPQKIAKLTFFGLIFLCVTFSNAILDSFKNWRSFILNAHVVQSIRQRLYDHMLGLSLSDLSNMKSGGIVSRLSGDVDQASGLLQSALLGPLVAIVQAITALVIVYVWNWRLALAITAVVPPMLLLHMVWVRRIKPIHRSMRADRSEIDGRAAETFGGIRVVRAFRREHRSLADYAKGQHTVVRKGLLAHLLHLTVSSGWTLLMPGVTLVIIWYGGYLVIQDQATNAPNPTTVGQLFAFQGFLFLLIGPVMQLANSWSQTQQQLAAMERIFDILAKPIDKPDAPDAIEAPRHVEEFRIENVSFSYRPESPVLNDISITAKGGQVIALVGRSGAGKTTLTDIIARFHDPTAGAVLLNGVDLRKFRLSSFRSLLAVVQQETFLFDGTIRENIAYSRRGASMEDVEAAARRANAHEFIEPMPEGYNTRIGERGVKLSGGQRQRLAIARAILADPQILILDEATSNLDSHSEAMIQSALAELFKGRTTFVIAHRLSTITHADQIIVMDKGTVVERGTHEELMNAGGSYFEMAERQRQSLETLEVADKEA